MKTNLHKAHICPKDIQRIRNISYKTARLYLRKIKQHFNKAPHQELSLEEYCEYTGLSFETVLRYVR